MGALAKLPPGAVPGPNAAWFQQQHNLQGVPCCNNADGHKIESGDLQPYAGPQLAGVTAQDQELWQWFRLKVEGRWYPVYTRSLVCSDIRQDESPPAMWHKCPLDALQRGNPLGHAEAWYSYYPGKTKDADNVNILCVKLGGGV